MTVRSPIGAAWASIWRVLCVLVAAGAASASGSASGSDGQARGAPRAPLADAVQAATDSQARGAGFDVSRHVIAAGGGRSTGAAFAVTGTIGQADADPLQPSTGGNFAVTGGFWPGQSFAEVPQDRLFANGFEAQVP